MTECKKCMRLRSIEVRHRDIEKTREKDLEQYYKRRDKELIRMRNDYRKNIEHIKEYQKGWRQDNPEKCREHSQYRYFNKTHDISTQQWNRCLNYFDYKCAYCGITQEEAKSKYNNNLHREHVDPNGVNNLSNCAPGCKQCNSEKRQLALDEWYNENNLKYSKDRHLKLLRWLNKDYKKFTVNNNVAI